MNIRCSNLLFVNQATSYGIDVLVNLDTNEVTYPKTSSNRRFTIEY